MESENFGARTLAYSNPCHKIANNLPLLKRKQISVYFYNFPWLRV